MLVPMTKVRILGRRDRLVEVLDHLYRLRLVQLEDVTREPALELVPTPGGPWRAARREELRLLLARLDGLLALAPAPADALGTRAEPPEAGLDALSTKPDALGPRAESPEAGLDALSAQLDALGPRVEELTGRVEALGSEEVVVGRYVDLLRRVLELVPELGSSTPSWSTCGSARWSSCSAARTRASPSCCGRSCARCWAAASCSSRPLSKARSAACSSTP